MRMAEAKRQAEQQTERDAERRKRQALEAKLRAYEAPVYNEEGSIVAFELPNPKRRRMGEASPSSSASSSVSSSLGVLAQQQQQHHQRLVTVKREAADAKTEATAATERAAAAQESLICAVCLDAERSVVYVPCAHFATCAECDEELETRSEPCPICQQVVTGRVREVRLP